MTKNKLTATSENVRTLATNRLETARGGDGGYIIPGGTPKSVPSQS